MKKEITLYWLKRDLRLVDNKALEEAVQSTLPLLIIYTLEPSLKEDEHYSSRHFDFIKESLADLNQTLEDYDTSVLCIYGEVMDCLQQLSSQYNIRSIYSTLEVGILKTFERDKQVKAWTKNQEIKWFEYQQNGVKRGRKDRHRWREEMNAFLNAPIIDTDLSTANWINKKEIAELTEQFTSVSLAAKEHQFQIGGRAEGLNWANSFFDQRIEFYSAYISKPELSRIGCSRLSPYLAWGCLSIREIYQRAIELKKNSPHKRQITAFTSRLKWQSHFMQKFESETRMEKEAVNKGFLSLEQPFNQNYVQAWKSGTTGYPLVDASIRSVVETGYLNFRMRTMITSFLTHHFQHFTTGAAWLAQQFLDFEPGIHYGQMQMQAGFTGINTIRVYNPTRNALEHDPDAIFIKKYLPELSELPAHFAIEPWKMTEMEQAIYDFTYGEDYPERIVDVSETRKVALSKLYGQRKTETSKKEIERILDKHTLHKTESRFP